VRNSGMSFLVPLVFLLGGVAVGAAPLPKVVCFDLSPFVVSENGTLSGPGYEYTQKLLAKAGVTSEVTMVPLARGLNDLDNGNTIFLVLARTPARETKYTWITEIFADSFSFATLPSTPAIQSYDDAKAANGKILVNHAGAPAALLAANNVTNIDDSSSSELQNYPKLKGGRGVGWFGSTTQFKMINFQAGTTVLQIGKPITPVVQWMVASKDVDAELVKKLQDAATELRKQGVYDKIFASLK
jgi:polar amino acid transport system substrate-binding protein